MNRQETLKMVEDAADKAGITGACRENRIATAMAFLWGMAHPENLPKVAYYTRADLDRIFGKGKKNKPTSAGHPNG